MFKILFAFDFDETIIDVDLDDWFIDAALGKPFESSSFACRPDYMQSIFATIHSRGYTREQILDGMDSIKISPSVAAVCRAISKSENVDAVIISDANTFCIKRILEANGLGGTFQHIISNPASFDTDKEDLLKVDYYHHNHGCSRCPANLCKSKALSPYKVGYDKIVYIGDNYNDICPSLSLASNDAVVAKKGFHLAKHVNDSGLLKATLHVVDFNEALVEVIEEMIL